MAIEDAIRKVVSETIQEGVDKLELVCDQNVATLDQKVHNLFDRLSKEMEKVRNKEIELLKKDIEKLLVEVKSSFIKQSGGKKWFWLK